MIKTPNGAKWITIPVRVKNRYFQKINETLIADNSWSEKHWNQIKQNYSKAKYFNEYRNLVKSKYENANSKNLSLINLRFIKFINSILNIKTKISFPDKSTVDVKDKTLRLIEICKKSNANIYLSGPSAKSYIDIDIFKHNKIKVEWISYSGYTKYHQLFPPFNHFVSILDLIFNQGLHANKYMKSFRNNDKSL